MLEIFVRPPKQKLLNPGERKSLGLQNADSGELEKMTLSITRPCSGLGGVEHPVTAIVTQSADGQFLRGLAVRRAEPPLAGPIVDRLSEGLDSPLIADHNATLTATVLLST